VRQQVLIGLRSWLVAAALAAIALPLGTVTAVVGASSGTPGEGVSRHLEAEADPTATPGRIPTPTPHSTPSPTPTPTATPTPLDERVAQITALAIIDLDGDLATVADRHAPDGPWQFWTDFGDAEVLSAEPTSNGEQPASWLITYTEGLQIILGDDWPPELALLHVECDVSHDTITWNRDANIVEAVLSGSGPLSLDCLFIHSPVDVVPLQGFIEAYAYIDDDADASTDGFEFPSRPVTFTVALDNADVVSAMPQSVDGDGAIWEISYPAESTSVVLTEIPQDGLELVRASCYDFWMEVRVPSTLQGNSVLFEAIAPNDDLSGHYACNFVNIRTDGAPQLTLPPTDIGGSQERSSVRWPALLLLFIATAVCLLASRTKRPTRGRARD
jgi:hypothetical protein